MRARRVPGIESTHSPEMVAADSTSPDALGAAGAAGAEERAAALRLAGPGDDATPPSEVPPPADAGAPRPRVPARRLTAAQRQADAGDGGTRAAGGREDSARDRKVDRDELARVYAERAELEQRLAMAQTDPLTGAFTRAAGLDALDRELIRCQRTDSLLVVAYLDVVGLKAVNDREGHAAGDVLLKTVVRQIRAQLRPYDIVMRLGGDEFLCAMPEMTLEDARRRFNEVAATLAAAPDSSAIRTGFAKLAPDEDATHLIARADSEMLSSRRRAAGPWTGPHAPPLIDAQPTAPAPSLSLALAGGPLAAARARAALGVFMDEIGSDQLARLQLIVTELVTNAVIHGNSSPANKVIVQVTVRANTVHGEVSDSGPGFMAQDTVSPREIGGLGLVIVDRSSSRWGTTHGGRRVWFEMERGGDDVAPAPPDA